MIFGKLGKMGEMVKQAKEMQRQLATIQIEKEEKGVKVKSTGEMEITAIEIDPSFATADLNKLQNNIKKAVNAAIKEAKMQAAKRLGGMSGLGL